MTAQAYADDRALCMNTGKVQHEKRSSARRQIKSMERRGKSKRFGQLGIFVCRYCSSFHVGHRVNGKR